MKKGKKHLKNSQRGSGTNNNEAAPQGMFPSAAELLEQAFRSTSKLSVSRKGITPLKVVQNLNALKITNFGVMLQERLTSLSRQFPKIDSMNPLYLDLLGFVIDVTQLKRNLAVLNSSARIIKRLRYYYAGQIYRAKSISQANGILRSFQGRVSSVIKKLQRPLVELRQDSKKLIELPRVNFELPTAVLCGFPNVGKTTVLKRMTGANAKIAPFPFTTKQINTGYYEYGYLKVQVIDTPGLLDRENMNNIEKKALAAIKHVADFIIFILDPTGYSGYELERQVSLLHKTRERFPKKQLVVMLSKADIATQEEIATAKQELSGFRIFKVGEGKEEEIEAIKQEISVFASKLVDKSM